MKEKEKTKKRIRGKQEKGGIKKMNEEGEESEKVDERRKNVGARER